MITTPLWSLLFIQILLGAFDTLFHHELTERLAWRKSQIRELRLHGVRNLVYAALFAGIGLIAAHGLFAWLVGAVLLFEVIVTLADFVEEDRSRSLPPSERVTHTLLALNYGAILALLIPVLAVWAARPTALQFVTYGWWTVLMLIAAVGVGLFGVRDLFAARRLRHMHPRAPDTLIDPELPRQSVLITGGTGFIGTRLVEALTANGHLVTVLTRRMENARHLRAPVRVVTDLEQIADDETIDVLINLAGEPIAGWLWTARHKRKVLDSRLNTTRALFDLATQLNTKPRCLISGSAIGIYGINADEPVDEDTVPTNDGSFSHELCAAWEAEAAALELLGIRTILLRIGLVLDTAGGPLNQMLFPFEFGLGGPFGKGDHWMSWITRDDLVRLIGHCIADERLEGPVNAVASNPVTNRDFVQALARALRRPSVISLPAWALITVLGDLGREIFLGSQNVLRTKTLGSGFEFTNATTEDVLKHLLNPSPNDLTARSQKLNYRSEP